MKRRIFLRTVSIAAAIPFLPMYVTCPSWFKPLAGKIKDFVPTALAAFASVLQILIDKGVLANPLGGAIEGIVNLIKAGFADVMADIQAYQDADPAAKATLLGKISTVLSILEDNLQQFWSDLTIPDAGLASLIESLLSVILSAINWFLSPTGGNLPAPAARAAVQLKKRIAAPVLKQVSVGGLRGNFNGLLENAGLPQYKI
jgi:hypothetical protein